LPQRSWPAGWRTHGSPTVRWLRTSHRGDGLVAEPLAADLQHLLLGGADALFAVLTRLWSGLVTRLGRSEGIGEAGNWSRVPRAAAAGQPGRLRPKAVAVSSECQWPLRPLDSRIGLGFSSLQWAWGGPA